MALTREIQAYLDASADAETARAALIATMSTPHVSNPDDLAQHERDGVHRLAEAMNRQTNAAHACLPLVLQRALPPTVVTIEHLDEYVWKPVFAEEFGDGWEVAWALGARPVQHPYPDYSPQVYPLVNPQAQLDPFRISPS